MAITKLVEFARDGDKSTSGLTLTAGFPRAAKPARQWFNHLFYQLTTKVNELATAIDMINSKVEPVLEIYDVGDVYFTTNSYANGAAVKAKLGYGTWVRCAEGRAPVGFSTKTGDPASYKTMGNEFGENTHTLSKAEMPSHYHGNGVAGDAIIDSRDNAAYFRGHQPASHTNSIVGDSPAGTREGLTETIGGDQPHNNIPPSVVMAFWLRTA